MALFNFNKSVKNQIKELVTFLAAVRTAGCNADYKAVRAELNLRVSTALAGMGFKENEDGSWSSTGWGQLPSKNETLEILALVDDFTKNIEPRFITVTSRHDDDMDIINPCEGFVSYDEDINNAKFKEIILGVMTEKLSVSDFLVIGRLAERLRKNNIKKAAYWAAGITLAIGVGVGVYMYKKNKAEEAAKEDTSTAEYDDVGSDVVITVEDDTPVIVVTDDPSEVTVLD